MKTSLILLALLTLLACAGYAAEKQVMAASKRRQILEVARAIFQPEVKTSVKIGKVNSPFSVVKTPLKK